MTTTSATPTETIATLNRSQIADLIHELAYYMAKNEETQIQITTAPYFSGSKVFIRVDNSLGTSADLKAQMIDGEVTYNTFEKVGA